MNERRNYKSVFDAWSRIVETEGVLALWTGCGPTIGRAMVVNVCQLCCQTQAKEEIKYYTKSMLIFGLFPFFKKKLIFFSFGLEISFKNASGQTQGCSLVSL